MTEPSEYVVHAISVGDEPSLDQCFVTWPALTLMVLDEARNQFENRHNDRGDWLADRTRAYRAKAGSTAVQADFGSLQFHYSIGTLVLVAGAGTSQAAGLPGWKELVCQCLREAAKRNPRSAHSVNRVLDALGSGTQYTARGLASATHVAVEAVGPAFPGLVRDVLRACDGAGQLEELEKEPTDLHQAMAALRHSANEGQPGISGIVTYNFDDLIEIAITRIKRPVRVEASYRGKWWQMPYVYPHAKGGMPIWHPHGFLPRYKITSRPIPAGGYESTSGTDPYPDTVNEADLVFSEEAYEQVYKNTKSFARTTQLGFFRYRVCLFIGCSFEDHSMSGVLREVAKERPWTTHYLWYRWPDECKTPAEREAWFVRFSTELAPLGVRLIPFASYSDYPEALRAITQMAREL